MLLNHFQHIPSGASLSTPHSTPQRAADHQSGSAMLFWAHATFILYVYFSVFKVLRMRAICELAAEQTPKLKHAPMGQ